MSATDIREEVRAHYASAALTASEGASCCGPTCCGPADTASAISAEVFGGSLYAEGERAGLPDAAVLASLGCGNPTAVAELREGETVLDLGSGGGIDVLLSARRVGPTGTVYGLDMTEEMLALARRNAREADVRNAHFLKGHIEQIPLPAGSVDVIISNCVINLSPDKAAVLREAARVLAPGGRLGISDVVADDDVTPAQRAERGSWSGCLAGALSRGEYLDLLHEAGFAGAEITFTHEVADGLHGAIIAATIPGTTDGDGATPTGESARCC